MEYVLNSDEAVPERLRYIADDFWVVIDQAGNSLTVDIFEDGLP
jgi:hypothetical protein